MSNDDGGVETIQTMQTTETLQVQDGNDVVIENLETSVTNVTTKSPEDATFVAVERSEIHTEAEYTSTKFSDEVSSVLVTATASAAAGIADASPPPPSQVVKELKQEINSSLAQLNVTKTEKQQCPSDEVVTILKRSSKSPPRLPLDPYKRKNAIQNPNSQYFEAWQRSNGPSPQVSPGRKSSSPIVRQRPSIERREQITRISEENETLANEVKVLCKDKSNLFKRVNALEEDLKGIVSKSEELVTENSELSSLVQNAKIEITARDTMLTKLTKDKCVLESEKHCLEEDKVYFENQLLEMNRKLRETSRKAEDAEAAVASVVQQIDVLNRNLAKISKQSDPTMEVQEIVKQLELHSMQTCKEVLKKELKKLTVAVNKAKDEAAEARSTIDHMRQEEIRHNAELSKMEKALRTSHEYSARLEKQEKLLKSNIELFEARVRSLENEVKLVRAERDAAIKEKKHKEAAAAGVDSIKASIEILQENAKRGHEEVVTLNEKLPELLMDKEQSLVAGKKLEETASELAASSATVSSAAQAKLVRLKKQVDALDAALDAAKEAAEESENNAWEMIAELSASPSSSSSNKLDLPAATTYLIGLGLLLYSIYISNHS